MAAEDWLALHNPAFDAMDFANAMKDMEEGLGRAKGLGFGKPSIESRRAPSFSTAPAMPKTNPAPAAPMKPSNRASAACASSSPKNDLANDGFAGRISATPRPAADIRGGGKGAPENGP
jgi:hypothetical protein